MKRLTQSQLRALEVHVQHCRASGLSKTIVSIDELEELIRSYCMRMVAEAIITGDPEES